MEIYETLEILGKNIQKIRTKKKITIKELSKKTEINEKYLKKIEQGTAIRISTKHLFKIATVLKAKPSELVINL